MTDHPHTDPGDGRTECMRCGKWVYLVTHSCKGVPVTEAARRRRLAQREGTLGDGTDGEDDHGQPEGQPGDQQPPGVDRH